MKNNQIQFDEPEYRVPKHQVQRSLFVDFLIKKGLAKDQQQAMYILFGIIGVSVLITMLSLKSKTITPPDNIPFSEVGRN